ncbi:glycosyltransferase family 2 protein [Vulcanisaeta distributa]|uniref:Glycosyl transferase family 2 n=1 Tax=Vulcanisaeta distributa (strain DSM 14429 / JCM 11212 / NBRC 100878 / IC-017) TaxID=572478 RepID=E1QUD9_VULDI|nr:glycosyltransferase [Vulcanisaeta distributa]ADN49865.1 glycosyl transferase family 2 [Vulcanisaeta distributa DSM 14429]
MCDVGIVMVTYNSVTKLGEFFNKVLESLTNLNTGDLNVRIAIVDNASSDATVQVVSERLSKEPKV